MVEPRDLPEFYSRIRIPSEFIDACNRFFPFIFQIEQSYLDQFIELCSKPPFLELGENADGCLPGYSSHFNLSEEWHSDDAITLLPNNVNRQIIVSDEMRLHLSFQARIFYASSFYNYRNNKNQEAASMIRRCLSICRPFIGRDIQSSAWFILARSLTNDYMMV